MYFSFMYASVCLQLSLTVDDWLQKVKRREKRERQRAQFLEQEENMFIRVRSQDECDRAFRQCVLVASMHFWLTFSRVFNSRFSIAFIY